MDDKELKRIGDQIVQGDFQDLFIGLGKKRISQKQALYLIICCCTACNAKINEPDKLKEQDVINLLKCTSKYIVKVTSEEFDGYLQSMFFICKLLLKKNFTLIQQLNIEILPSFTPKTLTEKQKGVYRSICELVRSELVNVIKNKREIEETKIISIGYLLSKIIITSLNHSVFSEFIFNYGACLTNLNVDLDMQYDYLLFNFEIIQNVEKEFNGNILHFVMYGMYVFSAYLKEGKLQQSRQCFEKVVTVMPDSKEWLSFKDVLSICRYMVHSKVGEDNLSTCRDALLDCVKVYGNSENFRNICKVISLTVNSYNSFHKSHESEIFFDDSNQLLMFYEIINEVMAFFTYNAEPCKKKCECSTKKNVPEGNKVAIIISNLFILHSSKNIISEEIIMKVIDYLKRYCKFLCFLKSNKCEKWDTYWLDIEVYLHNIGVILLRKENYDKLFQVGHMILKYNSVLRKMENGKVISNTMGLLSSAYFKQKNYAKALTWAAMEVVNTKESIRDKVLYKLIKIKAEARDKDNLSSVQEFTIVSVIEDIPVGYEFYVKDISNDREAQINLLTSELELYYEKWKSKVPMMSAFRQLTKIADNLTVMKVFIKMFCDWEIRVHENVVKLSEKIFEEFELSLKNSVSVEHRIFMVFVNFFKYKSKTSETIEKNIEEMRKIIKVLKAPSHPVDIMPADAYDQCDVVSAYEGLKIGRKEFEYLKLALQELEKICAIGIAKSGSFFGIFDIEKLYSLAKNIALEYGLHSDVYHSLKALSLALNIAEISENKHFVLECGGYLLKYLQNSELEKMMERIKSKLKNNPDSYKYLLQYSINLTYSYLHVKNVPAAFGHFKSVVEYFKLINETDDKIFWYSDISVELLRFNLMHASQVMKSNVEMEFSFGPLMKAYDLIVEKYTTASEWGPQALILLFEVLETLVKLYHELKMPREVRCFGKQTLTLAQQHVISVRSAKILTYLAYADFRSERLYDARVKLDGISEILLLENGRRDHDLHQKENKCLGISTMNDITQGIQEIMLDNPNPSAFNIKSSPSSPVFMGEPYRSPSFLKHKSCTCFQCTSAEYFQVAISRFHLEALWYMHKKQITLSNNFFRGTTEFCKELMSKQPVLSLITLQSSMLKRLKGGIDLKHIYSSEEYNYQCSLDHIKFLQTSGAVEAAKKCNKDLVDALKAKKSFYPNLFAEALLQRLGLIYQRKQMVQTVQISLNNVSNDYKFKTPEKTRPLVIKPKSNSPKIKRILPPKVIKFNLADVDCGTSTPAKSIKEYKTPSKSAKNKILPPSLREIKTPLMKTPVRKIFLDGDCKVKSSVKSSMSSNVLSGGEVSASITSCLEISDDGVSKRLPLIEISEQNFKYTNGSLQNEEIQAIPKIKIKDNLMEVKTKMLTAKLRKKVDIKSIPNNSCETNGQTRESTSKIKNNTSQEPGVSDSISKANGHSSKNSSSRKKVVNSHKNLAETETARRSRRNRT